MSANSRRVEKYSNCRKVFMAFAEQHKDSFNASFSENKDMLVMHLEYKQNDSVLNFYYSFGSNAIVSNLNEDMHLITASNPESAQLHIADTVEEWHKRNRLL